MNLNIHQSSGPRRVSVCSAAGASWRIKPEIRTLANIIAEREIACAFFKWREAKRGPCLVMRAHTLQLWRASKLTNPF